MKFDKLSDEMFVSEHGFIFLRSFWLGNPRVKVYSAMNYDSEMTGLEKIGTIKRHTSGSHNKRQWVFHKRWFVKGLDWKFYEDLAKYLKELPIWQKE